LRSLLSRGATFPSFLAPREGLLGSRGELCSELCGAAVFEVSPAHLRTVSDLFLCTRFVYLRSPRGPKGCVPASILRNSHREDPCGATESERSTLRGTLCHVVLVRPSQMPRSVVTPPLSISHSHMYKRGAYGQPRIHTGARPSLRKRERPSASLGSRPRIYPCHLCSYSVVYLESRKFRRGELPPRTLITEPRIFDLSKCPALAVPVQSAPPRPRLRSRLESRARRGLRTSIGRHARRDVAFTLGEP